MTFNAIEGLDLFYALLGNGRNIVYRQFIKLPACVGPTIRQLYIAKTPRVADTIIATIAINL